MNNPTLYSFDQLSIARFIIENQGTDQFGTQLYTDAHYSWALKVVRFFNRLYAKMRQLHPKTGLWQLAVRFGWRWMKKQVQKLNAKLVRQAVKQFNPTGTQVPPTRSGSELRSRRMAAVDRLQTMGQRFWNANRNAWTDKSDRVMP